MREVEEQDSESDSDLVRLEIISEWGISYLNGGSPFVEQSDSSGPSSEDESGPESDTDLARLDAELELVVPCPKEGLKALPDFGSNEEPDTPIKTPLPNPAAALLEWPMGGQDPKTGYKESPIGQYMSNEYPEKNDIEYWHNTSSLTPTDLHNLALDDTKYGRHLAVSIAMLLGWLPHKRLCPKCKGTMKILRNEGLTDKLNWACNNDGPNKHLSKKRKKNQGQRCNTKISVRSDTWLETFRQPLGKILHIIFLWIKGTTIVDAKNWTETNQTLAYRISKCARLILANFMIHNPHLMKIGGPIGRNGNPIRVQIDESCCGKMKYKRGKRKKQTWVLGGTEDPNSLPEGQIPRSFRLTVPNRTRATLIPILKFFIEQGSEVWSDGWSSYFCLGQHGFKWDWVNHSKTFKEAMTGVNTNRCEGQWRHMKQTIPSGTHRSKIDEYVQVFNFKEWAKSHPKIDTIGDFGVFGRANAIVNLNDKGRAGDSVPNMQLANKIVAANPLPIPPPPEPKPKKGPGRPPKRGRGRGRGRGARAPAAEAP